MAVREYIRRIFSVRKCVCCRSILSANDANEAFCPECDLSWQRAKTENCPECYGAASECSCMPKQLSNAGALTLRILTRGQRYGSTTRWLLQSIEKAMIAIHATLFR